MKLGRIIITTILLVVLNFLFTMLTCGWLFKGVYLLEPVNVWIPESAMTGKFLLWVYLGHLVLTFLFVMIFVRLYPCLPGKCRCCKGIMYGIFVWLLGVLPGMFATYMFMTVNKWVVLYWTVNGLVWLLIAGGVTGWICGNKEDSEGCLCCR